MATENGRTLHKSFVPVRVEIIGVPKISPTDKSESLLSNHPMNQSSAARLRSASKYYMNSHGDMIGKSLLINDSETYYTSSSSSSRPDQIQVAIVTDCDSATSPYIMM